MDLRKLLGRVRDIIMQQLRLRAEVRTLNRVGNGNCHFNMAHPSRWEFSAQQNQNLRRLPIVTVVLSALVSVARIPFVYPPEAFEYITPL